ncbi:MAG: 4Fe-4S dicluster domain-containing protein [Phycisphaerales bacterium]|nr:4Fe-4S dicluster domain-containing protein [Phycisphaerales bacterium]
MGISRRDLFRGGWRRRSDDRPSSGPDLRLTVLQRPPGAVSEGQFLGACTRCGDCGEACPPQAIVMADAACGEHRAGTPMIRADIQACVMCTDLPCISACEPGVLRRELPVVMAQVHVHEGGCLAWQGELCRVCVDACPVEDAILLDPGDRPRIDPSACTGCGTCLQVCPVGAHGIQFEPNEARPFAPLG